MYRMFCIPLALVGALSLFGQSKKEITQRRIVGVWKAEGNDAERNYLEWTWTWVFTESGRFSWTQTVHNTTNDYRGSTLHTGTFAVSTENGNAILTEQDCKFTEDYKESHTTSACSGDVLGGGGNKELALDWISDRSVMASERVLKKQD